jgi:hypothetical protein
LNSGTASKSGYLSGWTPYVELDMWRASGAIPISEIESDWSTGFKPRNGRNAALMRNRAAIGVMKDQWKLEYKFRQQASAIQDAAGMVCG